MGACSVFSPPPRALTRRLWVSCCHDSGVLSMPEEMQVPIAAGSDPHWVRAPASLWQVYGDVGNLCNHVRPMISTCAQWFSQLQGKLAVPNACSRLCASRTY